ncbi:MAG: Coenzyme F420 hydrogenase/dehydrogenase, beta subunit C-terminal domain [Thermoguttaceae bacterium]
MTSKNILETVNAGLCCGCAICSQVCPKQCISMTETPGGTLTATINLALCSNCSVCRKVCEPLAVRAALEETDQIDPFKGNCLKIYLVHATDPTLRLHGQSGGGAIGLAHFLLKTDQVNGVVTSFMPKDGSLRPLARIVRNPDELVASQGSKYVPIPWGCALEDMRQDDSLVVIGLPCHFQHLHSAIQTVRPHWKDNIKLKVSLMCNRTLSFHIIDFLLSTQSLKPEECLDYTFRSKIRSGWFGEGLAVLHSGQEIYIPDKIRFANKDAFTPHFCRLCFDKMGYFSDLVCGDPCGINEDPLGHSVILARTACGEEAIQQAVKAGVLVAEEMEEEQARKFLNHSTSFRRRIWTAFSGFSRDCGEMVPDYGVKPKWWKESNRLEKQLLRLQWERSRFVSQAVSRLAVLESVTSFNEEVRKLKKQIEFHERWGVRSVLRRILSRIVRVCKKMTGMK